MAAMSKEEKAAEMARRKEERRLVSIVCLLVNRISGSFTDFFLQRIEKLKEQKKMAAAAGKG